AQRASGEGWRRGWDSNPRAGYPTRRFRGAPVTTTSVPLRVVACANASLYLPLPSLPRFRRAAGAAALAEELLDQIAARRLEHAAGHGEAMIEPRNLQRADRGHQRA